jgi:hypothetical protein
VKSLLTCSRDHLDLAERMLAETVFPDSAGEADEGADGMIRRPGERRDP